jgi:hypothetical protein
MGAPLPLLRGMARREIRDTPDINILFRGNSLVRWAKAFFFLVSFVHNVYARRKNDYFVPKLANRAICLERCYCFLVPQTRPNCKYR